MSKTPKELAAEIRSVIGPRERKRGRFEERAAIITILESFRSMINNGRDIHIHEIIEAVKDRDRSDWHRPFEHKLW